MDPSALKRNDIIVITDDSFFGSQVQNGDVFKVEGESTSDNKDYTSMKISPVVSNMGEGIQYTGVYAGRVQLIFRPSDN